MQDARNSEERGVLMSTLAWPSSARPMTKGECNAADRRLGRKKRPTAFWTTDKPTPQDTTKCVPSSRQLKSFAR